MKKRNFKKVMAIITAIVCCLLALQLPSFALTVGSLSYSNVTCSSVLLTWNASGNECGAFGIYEGDDLIYWNGFSNATSCTLTGLNPSSTYSLKVKVYDAYDNSAFTTNSVIVTTPVDTQAPSAPQNVRLSNRSGTTVQLHWDASTDNAAVREYNVYCYKDGTYLNLGNTSTTYFDAELQVFSNYTFYVKAIDTSSNVSAASAPYSPDLW